MPGIKIEGFGGVVPRMEAHLLEPHAAQIADNVKLQSGGMRLFAKPLQVYSSSKGSVQTIYRLPYNGVDYWLTWANDVNCVPGAIAGDTSKKLYYTGDATPRKTNWALATNSGAASDFPYDYLELGVPAPASAPTLALGAATSGTAFAHTYCLTYVSTWGEESAPGPTATISNQVGQTVNLSAIPTAPVGKYSIASVNIYRTLTDSTGVTNYFLVGSVTIGTTTFSDTVADANLGAILESQTYALPPSDLKGLISLPNGGMAGFSGNTLCFCEPYKPWAWPVGYQYALEYPIVGIAANNSNVVVSTAGLPYLFNGVHPSAMTSTKLDTFQPGQSKRSMIDYGEGTVFASEDGLVATSWYTGGQFYTGTHLITAEYFKREDWLALNPSSMITVKYDHKLFIFYKTAAGVYGGFCLDPKFNILVTLNQPVDGVFLDPATSNLYIVFQNKVYQWDADPNNNLPATWRSKRFILPNPCNFGVAQIDGDFSNFTNATINNNIVSNAQAANQAIFATGAGGIGGALNYSTVNEYPVNGSAMTDIATVALDRYITFKLLADGAVIFTKNVTSNAVFRLPATKKTDWWEFEIDCAVTVYYLKVGETMAQLRQLQ